MVGLGLNPNELQQNRALTGRVLHDLNRHAQLPFADASFNVVLCTVSVDYLTRPCEVFQEVGRILTPGGLFLVLFSNRMFPQKAVKIWRQSSEEERILLVEDFFEAAGMFTKPRLFLAKGQPRPPDDKYAHLGLPSDPIYAIFADRLGGPAPGRPAPIIATPHAGTTGQDDLDQKEITKRKAAVRRTLRCPYCEQPLKKWRVPQTPFTEWDNEFMYICFNNACPYLVRGWEAMSRQGNAGMSYRLMYNPERDFCMPVPVPSLGALKAGIVE
jgi:SAM-dependent methyltransferase